MVVDEGMQLCKASKHLKINPSTAKMIIKTYTEKGKILNKGQPRKENRKIQSDKREKPKIEAIETQKEDVIGEAV